MLLLESFHPATSLLTKLGWEPTPQGEIAATKQVQLTL